MELPTDEQLKKRAKELAYDYEFFDETRETIAPTIRASGYRDATLEALKVDRESLRIILAIANVIGRGPSEPAAVTAHIALLRKRLGTNTPKTDG